MNDLDPHSNSGLDNPHSNAEENVGIDTYITSSPGIGGEIKNQPDYFYVEEVSRLPELHDDGRFAIIKVKKSDWTTMNFAKVLSNVLRISQKRVNFAGTKDKKAVSVQYFSVSNLNPEDIAKLKETEIKDAEIEYIGNARRAVRLGDLVGNFFHIILEGIQRENENENETEDSIMEIIGDLKEKGVPNYFGLQRFGSIRFITHEVGKHILKKDFESAFWVYVARPFPHESRDIRKIREELWESRDPRTGLKELPKHFGYERNLLQKYLESGSEEKALLSLPKYLKMMFVHAYQSYIFNRLISDRIREFGSLKAVQKGDFADFIRNEQTDSQKYPSLMESYSRVKDDNLERVRFLIDNYRGFLAFPLPGYETRLEDEWASEKIRAILQEDSIELPDFKGKYKEFSSKGDYRVADMPYASLSYALDDSNARFSFFLPKGCYATSFLREFTKNLTI
ncbi:MAG: tRNA pseudouridine(13) synthase TruD [Archaeoglobaceae archaeon]